MAGLRDGEEETNSGHCGMCRWGKSCEIRREDQEESMMARGSQESEHWEEGESMIMGVRRGRGLGYEGQICP